MREYRQHLELRLLDELLIAQAHYHNMKSATPPLYCHPLDNAQHLAAAKSTYLLALRRFNDLVLYHRLPESLGNQANS